MKNFPILFLIISISIFPLSAYTPLYAAESADALLGETPLSAPAETAESPETAGTTEGADMTEDAAETADSVSTAAELSEWLLDHMESGGELALSADIFWTEEDAVDHSFSSDIHIFTGGHTITVAAGSEWNNTGPFRFSGENTIFYVEQGGSLFLQEGAAISASGSGVTAVAVEDASALQCNDAVITVRGDDSVAVEARAGLNLFRANVSASGKNAAAIKSGGPVDLTLCDIQAEGDGAASLASLSGGPVAPGDVTLDTSLTLPVIEAETVIRRSAYFPVTDSPLTAAVGKGLPPLSSAVLCRLTYPGRPARQLLLPVEWELPEDIDFTKEGYYTFWALPEAPPTLAGFLPDRFPVSVYILDPNQIRLVHAAFTSHRLTLYFFRMIPVDEDTRLWYSDDVGQSWSPIEQAPGNSITGFIHIDDTFERDVPYYFKVEQTSADGPSRVSNVLKVTIPSDGGFPTSAADGDRDFGDREEQPDPPDPDNGGGNNSSGGGGHGGGSHGGAGNGGGFNGGGEPGKGGLQRPTTEVSDDPAVKLPPKSNDNQISDSALARGAELTNTSGTNSDASGGRQTPAGSSAAGGSPDGSPSSAGSVSHSAQPAGTAAETSYTGAQLLLELESHPFGVTIMGDGARIVLTGDALDSLSIKDEDLLQVVIQKETDAAWRFTFALNGSPVNLPFLLLCAADTSQTERYICTSAEGARFQAAPLDADHVSFDLPGPGLYTVSGPTGPGGAAAQGSNGTGPAAESGSEADSTSVVGAGFSSAAAPAIGGLLLLAAAVPASAFIIRYINKKKAK